MDKAGREEAIAKGVASKCLDNRMEIAEQIKLLIRAIVVRMAELIPEETNLDRLTNTLKVLCEIDGTSKNPTPGDGPVNTSILLIESLTQNFKDYESKTPLEVVEGSE